MVVFHSFQTRFSEDFPSPVYFPLLQSTRSSFLQSHLFRPEAEVMPMLEGSLQFLACLTED